MDSQKHWILWRQFVCRLKTWIYRIGYKNSAASILKWIRLTDKMQEDVFWSQIAKTFKPDFRVPSPEVALRFAFECATRYCFEANGRRLPLGCHAWAKYDRSFWEPFLLTHNDPHPEFPVC